MYAPPSTEGRLLKRGRSAKMVPNLRGRNAAGKAAPPAKTSVASGPVERTPRSTASKTGPIVTSNA